MVAGLVPVRPEDSPGSPRSLFKDRSGADATVLSVYSSMISIGSWARNLIVD